MLHAFAHPSLLMCAALAQAFDLALDIPPWVRSEMERLKEVVAELNQRFPKGGPQ